MYQTVTTSLSLVVNKFLKEEANNLYLAIGEGDIFWDEALPDVTSQVSVLFKEVSRKKIKSIEYFNLTINKISSVPSDALLITSEMFTGEDYLGPVRECGLFLTKEGISYLIAYSVFKRIDLVEQVTLTKNLIIKLV